MSDQGLSIFDHEPDAAGKGPDAEATQVIPVRPEQKGAPTPPANQSPAQERAQQRARQAKARRVVASRPSAGFLTPPVSGPVTSAFGYRNHPIYKYWGLHDGTDFGTACGQPLYAAADGNVMSAYSSSVYGKRLYLNLGLVDGRNLTVVYNHAASYTVGQGSRVQRGQVIGYVGSTGWSTGCHLHYSVLANGSPVDPENWF